MILYCDTSVLVKRYVEEDDTDQVDLLWKKASEVATSTVAYAEAVAAFRRKERERFLSKGGYLRALKGLNEEFQTFILIQLSAQLNTMVLKLVEKYPLRGFDAIHLASTLILNKEVGTDVIFACFDQKLNQAAKKEGLKTAF